MTEYIDREALLSELQEEIEFETPMYTKEQNEYFNRGLKCAIRDVKSQPKANVGKVKHGRWDCYEQSIIVRPHFRCSVCGSPRYEHYACNDFRYCPNCGAKMDL